MSKVKMLVELEYDAEIIHGDDQDAIGWFFCDILPNDLLILHSNEIGDNIGTIEVLQILEPEIDCKNGEK